MQNVPTSSGALFRRVAYSCILFLVLLAPKAASAFDAPLKFRKGVTVVHAEALPPMSFYGLNGEPKGFVVDLWRKWSAETGIPVEFVLTSWGEGLDLVRSGEADIHGGLFQTPARMEYFDFSEKIFPVEVALFSIKGRKISGMDDLDGKVVGVLQKGAAQELLESQYSSVDRKGFHDVKAMVKAFQVGEVDAVVTDYPNLMFIGGTMGLVHDIIPVEILNRNYLRAGVLKGNDDLFKVVREGLALVDDKERDVILRRWFVRDEETSNTLKIVVFLSLTGLIGAVLLLVFGGRMRRRTSIKE